MRWSSLCRNLFCDVYNSSLNLECLLQWPLTELSGPSLSASLQVWTQAEGLMFFTPVLPVVLSVGGETCRRRRTSPTIPTKPEHTARHITTGTRIIGIGLVLALVLVLVDTGLVLVLVLTSVGTGLVLGLVLVLVGTSPVLLLV